MYEATIVRRSGRRTKEHKVFLQKPPEDYKQSEQFAVVINGREIPVHVENPIDGKNRILRVA